MDNRTVIRSLFDDLTALAARVQQLTYDGPVTVWADEAGTSLAAAPTDAPPLTMGMAGTYAFMVPVDEIAGDLRQVLRERATDWILSK